MREDQISLYDLNRLIKNVVSNGLPDLFWIRAETSDVRVNQNGHCYLEFIQKDDQNRNIIAKARAAIWANTYQLLKMYFESETGQLFTSGLKVLVQVSVEFHELYGFSLNVCNIDPAYTLGDQVRNRALILKQLEEEGVLTLNKELELSPTANRIAIISSPTAAGYEDFCNQLNNNQYDFVFYPKLFPAIMQGDRAEDSILAALDKINEYSDCFDAVAIIRGGGASSELSCFDSYILATSCAQFPLPIVTGIGHERDDTVLDIVAHTRAKTPTAVAEFFIKQMLTTETELIDLQNNIVANVNFLLQNEQLRINTLSTRLSYLLKGRTKDRLVELNNLDFRLRGELTRYINNCKHQLEVKEQHLRLVSPENILKKGYTLTTKDNKIIKTVSQIKKGDRINTYFADGEISSLVE